MALSSWQVVKLCELCEETSIKWICVDCDKSLCDKCKVIHLKIPATTQHKIVTIDTPLGTIPKKIVIDNIPCTAHPMKMACLFCKSCDSLICPDCVSSSHKTHNFVPIDSALEERLDNVRGIRKEIEGDIKCCDAKVSEVQDLKSNCNAIFDESLTKIEQTEQELVDVIKRKSKLLRDEVEMKRTQMSMTLSKIETDSVNKKVKLEKKREETNAILTSNQGKVIFNNTIKIDILKFDSLPKQIDQFIPKKDSTKKIQEIFGSFQSLAISSPPEKKLEVIRSFTTDLPYIESLVTLDQESACICCGYYKTFRKIKIKDSNMIKSKELSIDVVDMATNSNGELLFTQLYNSDVKMLKPTGDIVSFMTVAPLLPCGIHVTMDDVIVGVIEPGDLNKLTDRSQRAIMVYGMDGKQKHKYQYDKDSKRLFTFPIRVTTNNNHDIVVVDRTSDNSGRMVVLNTEGNLRWLYEGSDKINTKYKFDPRNVGTTEVGNIIVSDFTPHAVHVLSENGEVLFCKNVTDIGIIYPLGLDIDKKGRLWLGCSADGEETGAKLHILKLTN